MRHKKPSTAMKIMSSHKRIFFKSRNYAKSSQELLKVKTSIKVPNTVASFAMALRGSTDQALSVRYASIRRKWLVKSR